MPKRRILEVYLNVVEWGDGVYGAEAAAQRYFNKSASRLTPEESVALASILPSPRKWSPLRETPFMRRRRSNILSRMSGIQTLSTPGPAPSEEDAPEAEDPEEESASENLRDLEPETLKP